MRARVAALIVLAVACATKPTEHPVASLASSTESQAAFANIRSLWSSPTLATARAPFGAAASPEALQVYRELKSDLDAFLARFPDDGLAPLARAYLALVDLDLGDRAGADSLLRTLENVPPGTTRDLYTTALARSLRLKGQPAAGMELLRPLVGKNVDPILRQLFEEEIVLTALATHLDFEAIAYMDTWLRGASEDEHGSAHAEVARIVGTMQAGVLQQSLHMMRERPAEAGYGAEIERIIAERLAGIAIANGDAELARSLLDPTAGALVIGGDAGLALGELATSRRGMTAVEGRTIGLLLPTESPDLRDETAAVLRGVLWALGLPKGIRSIAAPPAASPVSAPSGRDCPQGVDSDPALAVPDPTADEGLRLVTRDDAGRADTTDPSLDELEGQGAAVILAALDGGTADRAIRWSETHKVPVVLLAPPGGQRPGSSSFVVGEARGEVIAALAAQTPALTRSPIVPVVDSSEVALYPAHGGPLGSVTLLPPVSCDTPAVRAGEPRFPLSDWDRRGARGWLVTGSPSCASDLLTELAGHGRGGTVALTLEAAGDVSPPGGLHVVVASSGVVPVVRGEAFDDELRRYLAAFGGRLDWWTALGRDAATLARLAVRKLPLDTASDPKLAADRRALVAQELAATRARLWTSSEHGMGAEHAIARRYCVVDLSAH